MTGTRPGKYTVPTADGRLVEATLRGGIAVVAMLAIVDLIR